MEYILSRLGLSPEQDRRIRAVIAERLDGREFGDMSEDERGRLVLSVLAYLNQAQREALIRIVRGG